MNKAKDVSDERRGMVLKHLREKLNTVEVLVGECDCPRVHTFLWIELAEIIGIVDGERRDLIEGTLVENGLPF